MLITIKIMLINWQRNGQKVDKIKKQQEGKLIKVIINREGNIFTFVSLKFYWNADWIDKYMDTWVKLNNFAFPY